MSTKEISIHDQVISVSAPYVAGHVISDVEAKVLNQTRGENIGNNFRSRIKAALAGGEGAPVLADVLAELVEYDKTYTFSMPGPGREPVDPVEREARRYAKEIIKENLAAAGKKLKDVDPAKYEAALAKLEATEDVLKEARRRVKAGKAAATTALEDLGI